MAYRDAAEVVDRDILPVSAAELLEALRTPTALLMEIQQRIVEIDKEREKLRAEQSHLQLQLEDAIRHRNGLWSELDRAVSEGR